MDGLTINRLCILDILTSAWASSCWCPCCVCCMAPTPSPRTSSYSSSSWAWWWWLATGPGMSMSTLCLRTLQCLRTRWEWKLTHLIIAWHYMFQIGKIGLILTFLFCFLLVPIMMLYRHTELQGDSVITPSLAGARRVLRGINSTKYPPKYEDSKSLFPGWISNLNILHLIIFLNRFWTSLMKVLLIFFIMKNFIIYTTKVIHEKITNNIVFSRHPCIATFVCIQLVKLVVAKLCFL